MIVHRAAWVLPIDRPPIEHGWVAVENGRIAAVGGPHDPEPREPEEPKEPREPQEPREPRAPQAPRILLPPLVNAHVHLELSWLRGAVPPGPSMPGWAARLIERRSAERADPAAPIAAAIEEARRFGTGLVGDVSNTLASHAPLVASPLHATVFFEQIGFRAGDAEDRAAAAQARLDALPTSARVRTAVVPHAPYSVAPDLLRAIGALDRGPLAIHLGESAEEVRFLENGSGPWRALLERLGAWDPAWQVPGCGPVEYIAQAGLLSSRLMAVHGVQLSDAELARLAAAGATLVTCPRSNVWTGAGAPPAQRFYDSGVRVAVGTDSLASVSDLNMFAELAALRALAPGIPAARLLESATLAGARALGFDAHLGSIAPGKRAELLAVTVPPGIADVEEYLVSGDVTVEWL